MHSHDTRPAKAWVLQYSLLRVLAYGYLAFMAITICRHLYSERSGIASYRRSRMDRTIVVKRSERPEEFRNLMNARWLQTSIWIAGGLIVNGFIRRQNRLDPMSPSFQGQRSLDDLGKWLDEENEKRHRPLR